MTQIELERGRKILVDINVRAAAEDPDDDTPDVIAMLRKRRSATRKADSMSMPSC